MTVWSDRSLRESSQGRKTVRTHRVKNSRHFPYEMHSNVQVPTYLLYTATPTVRCIM